MSRRRALIGLLAASSLLGLGSVAPGAQAQEAPVAPEELFGTYELEARGVGLQATYEIEGLLPGGTSILDLTVPETLARFSSGSGYGLASLAFPGGLLVNLPSLLEQTGTDASGIPEYPIKAEAFFPSGPTEVDASQPGGLVQEVVTGPLGVESAGAYPGIEADPAVNIGSIRSASRSSIEDGKAVSRSRVELGDVNVLGGILVIDSIVTEVVAAHNGEQGSTAGGTVVSGVRFLGLSASLTEDGLILDEAPPVEGPAGPLGDLLDPVVGPLRNATAPVQALLEDVLDQAVPQVDDLLAQAGIRLEVVDPTEAVVESGAVTRASAGVSLTFVYEGREQQALIDLLNSVPDELKPDLGPIPFPLLFLAENHIGGLNLAPASVSSLATPPFPAFEVDTLPPAPAPLPLDPGAPGDLAAPDFSTPVPALPDAGGPDAPEGPFLLDEAATVLSGALPALLVALALLTAPLFGIGSTRLADNVLAPVSASCPTGADRPPSGRTP
jgi:hypothetical protein